MGRDVRRSAATTANCKRCSHRVLMLRWGQLALGLVMAFRLIAADITWTNALGTGRWSQAGNWSTNTVPGAADIAVFNGTSNAECRLDQNANVRGILFNVPHTGALVPDAGTTLTIGSAGFILHAGAFHGSDGALDINGGVLTQTGGLFRAPSLPWKADCSVRPAEAWPSVARVVVVARC